MSFRARPCLSNVMTPAFPLRIFVADDDPDGFRIVEHANWIGKALVVPCALLPQVKQWPRACLWTTPAGPASPA